VKRINEFFTATPDHTDSDAVPISRDQVKSKICATRACDIVKLKFTHHSYYRTTRERGTIIKLLGLFRYQNSNPDSAENPAEKIEGSGLRFPTKIKSPPVY
jgi:hypothetical protein